MSYEIRRLVVADLPDGALDEFSRQQEVQKVWRKRDGEWRIVESHFVDDWSAETKSEVTTELRELVRGTGIVVGALHGGKIIGWAAVNPKPLGSRGQYRQLQMMHVSSEHRGQGVGKKMLALAAGAARELGGLSLYASSQSSSETQAFYRNNGFIDAVEPIAELVEAEPFDCQIELDL